ncbi:glycosyltransferase family 10 protein, partial [Gonapodya prolifera JEL478]
MEPQGWPELTRTPSSYQYIASINNPANVFPDTRPPPSHIIQVTYPDHLPSEFQAPSAKYHRELELKQLKFAQEYTGNADTPVVLYMSSRCEGWRDEWVRRLMASGIAVVSTGHCIKSQQASALFPECTNDKSIHGGHPEMRKSKMCLMENFKVTRHIPFARPSFPILMANLFKFTLAIDNTLEPDYITEKLFDPLRSPTLPVYMGASNALSEYSPAEEGLKAWVDARDFGAGDDHGDGPGGRWHGIPELAAYLRLLHRNSSLYASYF